MVYLHQRQGNRGKQLTRHYEKLGGGGGGVPFNSCIGVSAKKGEKPSSLRLTGAGMVNIVEYFAVPPGNNREAIQTTNSELHPNLRAVTRYPAHGRKKHTGPEPGGINNPHT